MANVPGCFIRLLQEFRNLHRRTKITFLYSEGVLTKVQYGDKKITYTATDREGIEYMRLAFNPDKITVNGKEISKRSDLNGERVYTKRYWEWGLFAKYQADASRDCNCFQIMINSS